MKYLVFLTLLAACASVPEKVKKEITAQNLAGHWISYRFSMDPTKREVESDLFIGCDGQIRYTIRRDHALIMKESSDDGRIKSIEDGKIHFRSWIGLSWTHLYTKTTKDQKGCWRMHFHGESFSSSRLKDCTAPQLRWNEELSKAFADRNKPDVCL